MTEVIQAELHQVDLSPQQHLLDSGYVTSHVLVNSQKRFGIEVIGPAPIDVKWQAHAKQGFDISQFVVDWEQQQVVCPQGKTSPSWTPVLDCRGHQVFKIKFSMKDCGPCPCRSQCIHKSLARSTTYYYRAPTRTTRSVAGESPSATDSYLCSAVCLAPRYRSDDFGKRVRAFAMRRSRYIGLDKTHLQHIGIAAAINLIRIISWLDGKELAPTRRSAFQRLYDAA